MSISEPSTLLTDVLLAIGSGGFAMRLLAEGRRMQRRAVRCWGAAFLAVALTALAGGLWHGFAPSLPASAAGVLWKLTVQAEGVGSLLMLVGSAVALLRGAWRSLFIAGAILKWAAYAHRMMSHDEFRYVVYDSATAMLVLFLLHGGHWARARHASSAWIVAGVVASFGAAAVQQGGISPAAWFNQNDLFHALQLGANAVLFVGAGKLQDASR